MFGKRTSRSRQARIAHVEALIATVPQNVPAPKPQSEEEWLARFQQWANEGLYRDQPTFAGMLKRYQRAIESAKASNDPPFNPPSSFEPRLPSAVRQSMWQNDSRFPGLQSSLVDLLLLTKEVMDSQDVN